MTGLINVCAAGTMSYPQEEHSSEDTLPSGTYITHGQFTPSEVKQLCLLLSTTIEPSMLFSKF